jgi:hypothetical protein
MPVGGRGCLRPVPDLFLQIEADQVGPNPAG